jgi:uncharacterized protein (TIGR02391 family)
MMRLGRPIGDLLTMEPDEVGLVLLGSLRTAGDRAPHSWDYVNQARIEANKAGLDANEVGLRIAEGWRWLRNQGFLAPSNEHHDGWEVVTRAGRDVDIPVYLSEARALGILQTAPLDTELREQVLPSFRRGQVDLAVMASMRLVEVRVRSVAGLQPGDIGVKLMQRAFGDGGPLNKKLEDLGVEAGERAAHRTLFEGAIGVYKNPTSHRIVNIADANEAAETILFANNLLRLVDRLR